MGTDLATGGGPGALGGVIKQLGEAVSEKDPPLGGCGDQTHARGSRKATVAMEGVYLIKDNESGLHKIGMTTNWNSRQRALRVGTVTTKIRFVQCKDAGKWEKVLHAMFRHKRIPQSEWFRITEEEAIPKMNWLANKTNQPMLIGNWQQAQAGHYYRRRRSASGNWYTEQQSATSLRAQHQQRIDSIIQYETNRLERETRKEPGFWPTKEDPSKIEWQKGDPTRPQYNPWVFVAVLLGFILLVNTCSNSAKQETPSRVQQRSSQPRVVPKPERRPERVPYPRALTPGLPLLEEEQNEPEADVKSNDGSADAMKLPTAMEFSEANDDDEEVLDDKTEEMEILPIQLNGSLEDICKNSTSRVLRTFIRDGLEVQPARQDSIYVIGLEGHNTEEPPSPPALKVMRNQYYLQKYARQILDNCDQYSGVKFGFWSTNRWTTFAR